MSTTSSDALRKTPEIRPSGHPTMVDVARAARVSIKTVSRVVNDEPGVSPATAQRVREIIELLEFRRNDMARGLRQGSSSHTLGLVIGDVANPFYSAITRGVEEVAREDGYLVITGSSDEDPSQERNLVQLLCERRVDGLMVVPAGGDQGYLLAEMETGTPVVFLDRPPGGIATDVVLIDNRAGAGLGTDHLLSQGHRRIALIGDKASLFTTTERVRGYRDALRGHGIAADDGLVRLGAHDVASAGAAVHDLLGLDDAPTAIFCANNRITVGALQALHRREPRVAVVGFDDFELADMLAIPATVVAYDPTELGRWAAGLLRRRLAGEDMPQQHLVLPTWLITRGSGEVRP
jgi:LacI family transcriptional regulator